MFVQKSKISLLLELIEKLSMLIVQGTHVSCKYARKVGWKVCPMMYRVRFLAHNDEVVVESNAHLGITMGSISSGHLP